MVKSVVIGVCYAIIANLRWMALISLLSRGILAIYPVSLSLVMFPQASFSICNFICIFCLNFDEVLD